MNIDWDSVKYLIVLPVTVLVKIIWNQQKSIQQIKEDLAKDYPTWSEVHKEIKECSDQKDGMLQDQKEDLTYIRDKVDKIVDRELNKKE